MCWSVCVEQCAAPEAAGQWSLLQLPFIRTSWVIDLPALNLSCYFVSLTDTDTWNRLASQLLFPFYLVISSNYQTCLGLLMHYPLIGDVHSLILKALFLRDPKVSFPSGMCTVLSGMKNWHLLITLKDSWCKICIVADDSPAERICLRVAGQHSRAWWASSSAGRLRTPAERWERALLSLRRASCPPAPLGTQDVAEHPLLLGTVLGDHQLPTRGQNWP